MIMRTKNVKNSIKRVKSSPYILTEPKIISGSKIHLEIGSGKGKFIIEKAIKYPEITFIAVEKYSSICLRILEKQEELKLDNLIIINEDAKVLNNYLNKNSVDVIYLNFSDPWPKARYHKRRLTYNGFLNFYKDILKKDGKILFRTDHLEFFNDSIEYFKEAEFYLDNIRYDSSPLEIMSEYEILKRKSVKINSLTAKVEA